MRSICLALACLTLSGCVSEPLQEIAALSARAPTTIFEGVLDLPLMEGQLFEPGCGDDNPASACLVISNDARDRKAIDAADAAVRVYSGQLKKQGWTPLAYPFDQTFRSPDGIRCVDLWAGSFSSHGRPMRVAVQIGLDPTPVSCWERSTDVSPRVILPGVVDLPINPGDFLRDYASPDDARARVRFGKYKRDASNPYIYALVSRGWRIVTRTQGHAALSGIVDGRERCLTVRDMVVIFSRSDRSWAYSEFRLMPDGAACG